MFDNANQNKVNFVIYSPSFNAQSGGVIALFNLANLINKAGYNSKIFDFEGLRLPNIFCERYADLSDVNDFTIVVYPEVVPGNPLKAKYVVRWILCELGVHCSEFIYQTWGKDDFVYHYGTYNPEKSIDAFNLLCPLYLSSIFQNRGKSREGYCHIVRKGYKFHQPLVFVHPFESLHLQDNLSQETLCEIFQHKEYLVSYDPYSYISFLAALCGCVSIVVPFNSATKEEWLKTQFIRQVLEKYGEKDLSGIAYGFDDIEYARRTLHQVKYQQELFIQFGLESVHNFLDDMIACIGIDNSNKTNNKRILKIKDVYYLNDISSPSITLKAMESSSQADENSKIVNCINFLCSSNLLLKSHDNNNLIFEQYQNCLLTLLKTINNRTKNELLSQSILCFIHHSDFSNLYSIEANLKDIYSMRSEIIDMFLITSNYNINYDFSRNLNFRKKIRLGILIDQVNYSEEAFASLCVYEYLGRDFEVILYTLSETGYSIETYCKLSANFFKILPPNLKDQVSIIRNDNLDILHIASNITRNINSVCLLAAHRLARIQVTSTICPTTTGMKNIDYYILGHLDEYKLKLEQENYSEKLITIEGSGYCFSYGDAITQDLKIKSRNELGIAKDSTVFISCLGVYQINPELITTWISILNDVCNSNLVLAFLPITYAEKYFFDEISDILSQKLILNKLSPDRIITLDCSSENSLEEITEYCKLADLYLDSFPCSSSCILIAPLKATIPIITKQGISARTSAASLILNKLNLSELVALNKEEYRYLSISLALNKELRTAIQAKVHKSMTGNPEIFDSRNYARKLEELFKTLHHNYQINSIINNYQLQENKNNLIIFPNWSANEDELYTELFNLFKSLITSDKYAQCTLLINTGKSTMEDVELFISSVVIEILLEDGIDLSQYFSISLLPNLSTYQWVNLLPLLLGRIPLLHESDYSSLLAGIESQLPILSF